MFIKNQLKSFICLLLVGAYFEANAAFCFAQQNMISDPPSPSQIIREGLAKNNYLAPLLELKRREAEYLASKRRRINYFDYMVLINSYVADYAALYENEEKFLEIIEPMNKTRERNAKDLTQSPIDDYQPKNALKAIEATADNQQVIMINEEHRTPLHRGFTTELLPILYKKGFRYLALETLKTDDTELNKRGYPTQKSGTYSADPVYGDMMRTALKLGYKLVPYDSDAVCQPKPDDPISCDREREREQAQNLYDRILKNDPQAKILVHGGRSHIAKTVEADETKYAYMAWHFREITKIDPFTIDQMQLGERRNPADEEPLYRYITRKWNLTEPTVFLSPNGEYRHGGAGYDMQVVHPRAKYVNNRPTWMLRDGRKPYALDLKKLKLSEQKQILTGAEPLIAQVFVPGESVDAVPIDQIVLYPGKDVPSLLLPKGKFIIQIKNAGGEKLKTLTVKM